MASQSFDFIAPDQPNLVRLFIFEASSSDGPWVRIDEVDQIGTYPTYIGSYTTENATAADDWFAIQWMDDGGALSKLSTPLKGGTNTLVGAIVDRVLQRDMNLSKDVVRQEAEAAIQLLLGENVNPYDPSLSVSYRVKNGLTYLVLARTYLVSSVTSSASDVQQATIGVITMKTQSGGSQTVDVSALLEQANDALGIGIARVLQMAHFRCLPRYQQLLEA